MTPADLTRIKAYLEKATPGDWRVVSDPAHFDSLTSIENNAGLPVAEVTGRTIEEAEANAALLANAKLLVKAVEEMQKEQSRLAGLVESCCMDFEKLGVSPLSTLYKQELENSK